MTTYLDLYAITRQHNGRATGGSAKLAAARNAGYSEAGIRSLVTSIFSSAR